MTASKTSIIVHPAKTPLAILRADYLDLCNGNKVAAMLLNVFEHWTNTNTPDKNGDIWIYRSRTELSQDILGIYKENSIDKALSLLVYLGYISKRNNPERKNDRKKQYRMNVGIVQSVINLEWLDLQFHSLKIKYPFFKNQTSMLDKSRNDIRDINRLSNRDSSPDGETGAKSTETSAGEAAQPEIVQAEEKPAKPKKRRKATKRDFSKELVDPLCIALGNVLFGHGGDLAKRKEDIGQISPIHKKLLRFFGDNEQVAADEIVAWGNWYRASNPEISLPLAPDKVKNSLVEYRGNKQGKPTLSPKEVEQRATWGYRAYALINNIDELALVVRISKSKIAQALISAWKKDPTAKRLLVEHFNSEMTDFIAMQGSKSNGNR